MRKMRTRCDPGCGELVVSTLRGPLKEADTLLSWPVCTGPHITN